MPSYKRLYLVTEEEYFGNSARFPGGVSKIGGPVTAGSSVNNIEVGQGGSVVIDRHGHRVDCDKAAAALSNAGGRGGKEVTSVGPKQSHLLERRTSAGGKKSATFQQRPRVPAARSTKLSQSKKEPNALARNKLEQIRREAEGNERDEEVEEPMEVDWEGGSETVPTKQSARQLEKTIAKKHSQRSQKEKEKILLDTLKVARVKELQGERGAKERRNEAEQERQIVHELRDIYRDEVKKGAVRARLGPRLVPTSDDGDVRMQQPAEKRRAATAAGDGPAGKRVGSGRSLTPSAALAAVRREEVVRRGVKRAIGGDGEVPDEYGKVKLARYSTPSGKKLPSLPPQAKYGKRGREEEEDDSTPSGKKLPPLPPQAKYGKRGREEEEDDDLSVRLPSAKRPRRKEPIPVPLIPHSVKRKSLDSWPGSARKRSKVIRPWKIREKRPARSTWSTSAKKRRKGDSGDDDDDSDDDSDDDDDTSDDGNGGEYKKYLDKLYKKMNVE